MHFLKLLLSLLSLGWLTGVTALGAVQAPRVFLWDGAALVAAKGSLASADSPLGPALKSLLNEAELALKTKPVSVMDKELTPASGDKHDYYTFGPYWWPDPSKPNGLPYIRRDGQSNRAANEKTDKATAGKMAEQLETLALAYWFTGQERFAEKAAEVARVWFLAPATRMNPNFQFAQAVPGRNEGRGFGIIEAIKLVRANESLALLQGSPAWTASDQEAMRAWMAAFYQWLTESKNGREEKSSENNHGSWYDYQVAHLALFLGRNDDAKKILTEALKIRLAKQIEPDGAQPLELERTRSLDYSCFNLEALFSCAQLARHVDLEWWAFATKDGRSLRAALGFIAPYADPKKSWPKKDLRSSDRDRLLPLLGQFLRHQPDAQFKALFEKFGHTLPASDSWRLIYNQPLGAEIRAAPAPVPAPAPTPKATPSASKPNKEVTPLTLPDSEAQVYRTIGDVELRLHVVKPKGWSAGQRRPVMLSYFGGGWITGTPQSSLPWAKWAASFGFVGIAPDYRTRGRHGTAPEASVADARAAVKWVVDHAAELGVDPAKIVCLGNSAGGHVAAWTAIARLGPGQDDPAPAALPAALILLNPVTDTEATGYGGPKRFDDDAARARASSVTVQMPERMPPTIVFHGDADATVAYANSIAFRDQMIKNGNRCELVTFPELGHTYYSEKYGAPGQAAKLVTLQKSVDFLGSLGLIPSQ